jgi:translation initiation factor IF-1
MPTTRTIYLDDRRARGGREIHVRSGGRHYQEIVLNRDSYLWHNGAKDASRAVPAAFLDAVEYARTQLIDRIWYAGYDGGFSYGIGDSYVYIYTPHAHVDAAVEALRAAELHANYQPLHTLGDAVKVPYEQWLAPGERVLVRGTDYDTTTAAFRRYLRHHGKRADLRMNVRVEGDTVRIRPVPTQRARVLHEYDPEKHPLPHGHSAV